MDITNGIVVRGLKNENLKPFSGEILDNHDRLTNASVNCAQGVSDVNAIMRGMPNAMHKYGYCKVSVKKIIQKGGRVIKAPLRGNPNHCLITGLKLSMANSLFSNKTVY